MKEQQRTPENKIQYMMNYSLYTVYKRNVAVSSLIFVAAAVPAFCALFCFENP
jgi:hypothetical protein